MFLALGYLLSGILMCNTIIGIPFGVQSFKLAGQALARFGEEIVKRGDVTDALAAAIVLAAGCGGNGPQATQRA